MLTQKKSRICKKNMLLILILLIILISGCTDRQSLSNSQGDSVELHETGTNSDIEQESICKNIENEIWMKRCLAYEEKNPTYCEFFDTGSSSDKTERDNCYYDLSVHSEVDVCSKISNIGKKWSCRAIVKKDPDQCKYSNAFETEMDCLKTYADYYNDKSVCDIIGNKDEEITNNGYFLCVNDKFGNQVPLDSLTQENLQEGATERCNFELKCWCNDEGRLITGWSKVACLNSLNFIEESQKRTTEETIAQIYQTDGWEEFINQDCSIYVDENEKGICLKAQAIQNRDSQKCLLITSNGRESCIIALALLNEDLQLCKELESNRQIACIKPYAHFNDIDACLDLNKLDKNECILYAVSTQNENQKIEPQICEEIIKDENKKSRCYLEFMKSKLIS